MSLDPDGVRFYFKTSYRVALVLATIVLFTSSVALGDGGKLVVETPLPLFLSAVIGAVALAMFSVPYITISDGTLRIYMIFSKKFLPAEKIVRFVIEEGGSVKVNMLGGEVHHIRLYHVSAKERPRLLDTLSHIAPLSDERKEASR